MADKTLLELPLATSSSGALLYGVQNNEDKAFPPSVLIGNTAPQAANFVYAGPTVPPGGVPSFRRLVANDIPDLSMLYMATTGGNLISPNINNPNIIGGTISGTRITVDDDKWFLRNATDTTKVVRFNAANLSPGTTRIITVPDASGELVLTGAAQIVTNKNITTLASSNLSATFNIPHGTPPTAPKDGDIWTTSGGIYARVSGVTVGPLAAEQTSYVTSFNTRTGAITLLPTDVTNALGYTPWNTATNLTTSANISVGAITAAGVATMKSNAYVEGSFVIGAPGNAQLTVNSDAQSVFVESSLFASGGGRKTLNVYADGMEFTSYGVNFRTPTAGANVIRVFADGSGMTLGAVNSAGSAFTPLVIRGSETQVRDNAGGIIAKFLGTGIYTEGRRIQSAAPGFDPATGTIFASFLASGNYGGGYAMQDGGFYGCMYMANGGIEFGMGAGALESKMRLDQYGNVIMIGQCTANGGFQVGSDPRLKDSKSLRTVDNALEKVYNLNVRYGKYNDWFNSDGKERVFLMADNALRQNIPQAITKDSISSNGNTYDGWSAEQMIAFLVKAVQELTDKVSNLEEQINEQQSL